MANLFEHVQRGRLLWDGFRSFQVPTSVGRVHVLEKRPGGPLPTIAFLHGFSASSVQYGPLMRRLGPDARRLFALDLPAHGFSDAPARGPDYASLRDGMFATLDRLLAWNGPAVLLGNSMGGFAAVRYALSRPERVLGLVLVSPGGAFMDPDGLEALLDSFRLETPDEAVDFMDRLFAAPHPLRRLLARPVLRQLQRREMRELIDAVRHHDLLRPEEVQSLQIPVCFIWGDRDGILPRQSRDFFIDNLPASAEIHRPPDFGHSPQLEAPDELARIVRGFCRSLGSDARAA